MRDDYTKVHKQYGHTGAGIQSSDTANTLEELLKEKCIGYAKLDALFWKNPHVQPACKVSTGQDGIIIFNSRANTHFVGGPSTAAPEASSPSDNDWIPVDDDCLMEEEDEEEGEHLGDYHLPRQQCQGSSFQGYRAKNPTSSVSSWSSSSRKRSECSSSPAMADSSAKGTNVWKTGPISLHDHPPLMPSASLTSAVMHETFNGRIRGKLLYAYMLPFFQEIQNKY